MLQRIARREINETLRRACRPISGRSSTALLDVLLRVRLWCSLLRAPDLGSTSTSSFCRIYSATGYIALLALLFCLTDISHAAERLAAVPVTDSVLRALDRFELRVNHLPRYKNPFDPNEIQVQGRFLSPSGRQVAVDGFYFQDFTRALEGGRERLTPLGVPQWRVRFTPNEVGTWAWWVTAKDARRSRQSAQGTMRVLPALPEDHGFIRTLGAYFGFSDGAPFFPVGENLAWAGADGTFSFDLWMGRLERQKASYARVWVGPPTHGFAVEQQLGRFDQEAAWRLDHVLRLAEATGLNLSLCAESFNALRKTALWKVNPYNRANGGPLVHPADFFTNARARDLFKTRLRYLCARYGYSPHLFSWELFNEVDLTDDFNVAVARAWHQEMGRALRAMDRYDHLISTSFSAPDGAPSIDALPEIDYVQTHIYGPGDTAEAAALQCQEKANRYGKPALVSEVGASVDRDINEKDDLGIWMHDGLWAPIFSGGAGTGMPWWWDSFVDGRNRYGEFGAVEQFVREIPWTAHRWKALTVLSTRYEETPTLPRDDVIIAPSRARQPYDLEGVARVRGIDTHGKRQEIARVAGVRWQEFGGFAACDFARGLNVEASGRPAGESQNQLVTVEVRTDGTVSGGERLSRILYADTRPDLFNPVTFLVDYPQYRPASSRSQVDGRFIVHVVEASAGALLRVTVDGRVALEERLERLRASYCVTVPSGRHAIKVENSGSGWVTLYYELPGYRRPDRPNVRVTGRGDSQYAIVWVENRDHTWLRRALGKAVRPVPPSVVVLDGFLIGEYTIEQWNTRTGTSIPLQEQCVDRHITLHVPTVESDVAYIIRRRLGARR